MPPEPALDLSPRLSAIAELVPEGARVADIGCDHGLLARHLVRSGRCGRCVATEIDEVVLSRARRSAEAEAAACPERSRRACPERSRRADRISWRAGRGLEPLDVTDRLDTLVLAGLGASAIAGILDTPRLSDLAPSRLIVQPQTSPASLRGWLVDHGWTIVAEKVVRDRGRLYEIAAAERAQGAPALSHPELSRDDLLAAGPVLVRDGGEEVIALWESRRRRLERIAASGARGAMAEKAAREAQRARRILNVLRKDATSRGE